MTRKISQVKIGIVLSYVFIIINTLYNLFITPYIIKCLGDDEYGVFKTIGSLTASLIVIDLGIGSTVQRYVAKYIADKEEKKISNFIAMNYIQAFILILVLAVISVFLFLGIEPAYQATFTSGQIVTAKNVFLIMALSMAFQFFGDVSNGVIIGYNHFAFGNGVTLAKIILRIFLVYFLLFFYQSAITLALVDLGLSIVVIIAQLIYIKFALKLKIRLEKWDKSVFFDAGKYTLLMFITTLVTQFNSNVDNIVIGAISGPNFVTVYSIGLLFFMMFQNLSCAISGVMLPTIANAMAEKDSEQRVIDIIVKAGRIQFLLIGAGIVGFVIIGKDFLNIWLGESYSDAYIITLILVIPSIFELCINVCLSILRVQNRLVFRTVALLISTVVNIIITFLAVKYWSYIGAAFGTAASYIGCSLIAMNIYYSKVIGLPMLKIYKRIVHGIWPCLIIGAVCLFGTSRVFHGSYIFFALNVIIFCVVYAICLLLFGLNEEEKGRIPVIRNLTRKKNI